MTQEIKSYICEICGREIPEGLGHGHAPMTKETKKTTEGWEKSLNIDARFSWATEEQRRHILAEIKFQRDQALSQREEEIMREQAKWQEHIDKQIAELIKNKQV